ncbi:MAG: PQQ-dependent sugar dehydrogenase [bacterium]
MRRLVIGLVVLLAVPAFGCPVDCNGDARVSVDELVSAVELGLDGGDPGNCTAADVNGDGAVTIDELIAGVAANLGGCAAFDCGDGVATGAEACDDGNRIDGDGCSAACELEPGGDPCAGVAAFPGVAATTALVTDAVDQPVYITAPRLDTRRVFIVEQPGRIRVVEDGLLLDTPFLAIEPRVSCCGERGLLSLAFHPDYASNGRFFVNYTNRAGNTVVARYQVGADADRANPDSEQILITVEQPFANHNGGQLAFGPDGYLYLGMGDGGGGGDPRENGQNDASLLGKLLRLDVDVETTPFYAVPPDNPHAADGARLGLIWAKGLRNPWRFSFDRATGDLYIGDVGQDRFEEIDVQPAGSRGGENYGWDIFEGNACFEPDPAPTCPEQLPPAFTPPVLDYGRADGSCSVTGGLVYRGCALPDLRGQYFFSDYCSAFLKTFTLVDGTVTGLTNRTSALAPGGGRSIATVVSFGADARGELYIADLGGEIYKLVPQGR